MTAVDAPPALRPPRAGGLTLPVLAFAALVASPAIWQCLVRHELPTHVMLERYVLIAIGCLAVSEVARRLLPRPAETSDVPSDATSDVPSDRGVDPTAEHAGAPAGDPGDPGGVAGPELGGQAPADTLLLRSAREV
jgi:hypothetical protein